MKIVDILNSGKVTVSCELFPPKAGSELTRARTVVRETAALSPSFISVTYGAGGTNSGFTLELAEEIEESGVTALAHLTCVCSDREKIRSVLEDLKAHHIENILALRGDLPADGSFPRSNQYTHASDLMRDIQEQGDFCIGGACYPEGHPEAPSLQADLDFLKCKVESGCSFLTTQMFFDNNILYNFMFRLLKTGVDVPVIAGIMPVTNPKQITRICSLSGTALPPRFKAIVDKFSDNPAALKQAGIAYATEQIIDLVANGVNHIHLYTMNRPDIAGSIMHNLSEIFQ